MLLSNAVRSSLVLLGSLSVAAIAAPTESPEMVSTPAGLRPAANVRQIPDGATVRHMNGKVQLVGADGNVLNSLKTERRGISRRDYLIGWISFAYYNATDPADPLIKTLTTSWVVPPPPNEYIGQTVYLFPGIEPTTGESILQPVLQYGPSPAGGGEYWSVATWFATDTTSLYTPLVEVSVGQVLTGVVELTGTDATSFNYSSGFTNVAGSTSLQVNVPDKLGWAVQALEVYNITGLHNYPPGATSFYDIDVTTVENSTVKWVPINDPLPSDNITCVVDVNGPTNAKVTITYPPYTS